MIDLTSFIEPGHNLMIFAATLEGSDPVLAPAASLCRITQLSGRASCGFLLLLNASAARC